MLNKNLNKQSNSAAPQFMVYPKRKSSGDEQADMYLQFYFQLNKVSKSLGLRINFKQWDTETHSIKGQPLHNQLLQQKVDEYTQKTMGAFYMLTQNGGEVTLREIIDAAFGKGGGKIYSLFSVFEDVIMKMEKLKRPEQSGANLLKHRTCLKHLKDFVKQRYQVNDIPFTRINRLFIDDFEHHLRTDAANGHNSANKMLQIFKKVYRIAVDNRWTAHNAFAGKRLSYKDPDIEFLTASEIQQLREVDIQKEYLRKARDLFTFCIFTGVAYIDLQHLRRRHIETGGNGTSFIIRKKREKTGVEFMLPLFQPARQLLDQWNPDWENAARDTFLVPRISNQKFNNYLKEVIALAGIQKHISTHSGRHTFCTSVTLENGIGMESVSKMVGHSKIQQTQKYARVTAVKLERETKGLSEMLFNETKNAVK